MVPTPKYKFYYFDARGVGEPIRYILKLKNIPFEDIRAPMSIPPAVPADMKKLCPFGQFPILQIGDRTLSQSRAIGRYLAKKYGLTGKDEFEEVQCDELVDATFDFYMVWVQSFYTEDEAKKVEARKAAIEKGRERYLTYFNKLLDDQKGKGRSGPLFLVREDLTWADIFVANVIYNVQKAFQVDLVSEFPLLEDFLNNVFSVPGIKEYIQERPETQF